MYISILIGIMIVINLICYLLDLVSGNSILLDLNLQDFSVNKLGDIILIPHLLLLSCQKMLKC